MKILFSGATRRFPLRAGLAWAACAALLSAHAADPAPRTAKLSDAQARALGIETAALVAVGETRLRGLPAEVVIPSSQLQWVAAPVGGLIERVLVPANTRVRAGQVLARIQSPMLADLQRGYVQASVQARIAADNLQRDEALFRDGIVAEARVRLARAQQAEAQAGLAERRAALRMAGVSEAQLKQAAGGSGIGAALDVPAPVDATVIEQLVQPGARVEAAAPMFKLARLDPLWLEIQLPAAQAARVAPGAAVALANGAASGRVLSVAASVGPNQTVSVRAEVPNRQGGLIAGQAVEVDIALARGAGGAFRVPDGAIVRIDGADTVFVKSTAGFTAVRVKREGADAAGGVVSGPFKGDERIAVSGLAALKAQLAGIGAE